MHMYICAELIDPSVLIAIKTEGVKLRVSKQWGNIGTDGGSNSWCGREKEKIIESYKRK